MEKLGFRRFKYFLYGTRRYVTGWQLQPLYIYFSMTVYIGTLQNHHFDNKQLGERTMEWTLGMGKCQWE